MEKKSLRKQISQDIKACSAEELAEWSHLTCLLLLANDRVNMAETIVAFWPLPDEVDIRPAVRKLYRMGKTVLLPHVVSDTEMVLCRYEGDASLKEGAFGIMEPLTINNEQLTINNYDYQKTDGEEVTSEVEGNSQHPTPNTQHPDNTQPPTKHISPLSGEGQGGEAPVILVPGRAFDFTGHRLGRGKGYYDRFLAGCPDVHTIGVSYPFQIIEEVPSDTHDIKIKELLWKISKS